jgi:hypothetical protein
MRLSVTANTVGAPKSQFGLSQSIRRTRDKKKLRCLQIANDLDAVTLSPPDTFDLAFPYFVRVKKIPPCRSKSKLRSNGHCHFSTKNEDVELLGGLLCVVPARTHGCLLFSLDSGPLFSVSPSCFYVETNGGSYFVVDGIVRYLGRCSHVIIRWHLLQTLCCTVQALKVTTSHSTGSTFIAWKKMDTLGTLDIDSRRGALPYLVTILYCMLRGGGCLQTEQRRPRETSPISLTSSRCGQRIMLSLSIVSSWIINLRACCTLCHLYNVKST